MPRVFKQYDIFIGRKLIILGDKIVTIRDVFTLQPPLSETDKCRHQKILVEDKFESMVKMEMKDCTDFLSTENSLNDDDKSLSLSRTPKHTLKKRIFKSKYNRKQNTTYFENNILGSF